MYIFKALVIIEWPIKKIAKTLHEMDQYKSAIIDKNSIEETIKDSEGCIHLFINYKRWH
jgi:hypothetical protein